MNWPLTLALLFAFGLIISNILLLLRLANKPFKAAEVSNSTTTSKTMTKTNQKTNSPEQNVVADHED